MQALVCCPTCPDGVELRLVEDPRPDRDEVVVAVQATSLNLGNIRRLRWERDGWITRTVQNRWLALRYALGASPERLAAAYARRPARADGPR